MIHVVQGLKEQNTCMILIRPEANNNNNKFKLIFKNTNNWANINNIIFFFNF